MDAKSGSDLGPEPVHGDLGQAKRPPTGLQGVWGPSLAVSLVIRWGTDQGLLSLLGYRPHDFWVRRAVVFEVLKLGPPEPTGVALAALVIGGDAAAGCRLAAAGCWHLLLLLLMAAAAAAACC